MGPSKKTANNGIEILVVEDSRTQAEQLKYLLEGEGYTVTIAANGKEAVATLRERKPTLVITDVLMPEMDGFALCKEIKSQENLKDIPVILMTSLSSANDIMDGLACGADNFIRKPYDEKYLLSRIEFILVNRKLRRTERTQFGVQIYFIGKKYFITSERQQILDLLISTYEDAVRLNEELRVKQEELAGLAQQLERKVEERTAALTAEIAERRRSQEALRLSEERLRMVINNSPVVLCAVDRQGVITVFEGKSLAGLGLKTGEAVGRSVFDLYQDYPDSLESMRRALGGESTSGIAQIGKVILENHTGPIRDDKGEVMGAVGVAIDVTDRMRLEEQLRQAAKMEAIGQLAGGVAHDFNNLLTVISGYSQLLLERLGSDGPLPGYVTEIQNAANRATSLTRQLLAFGRRQLLAPQVLDLNNVVVNVDKMLRRLIGEDIDLVTHLEPNLGRVKADPGQIEQIIMNLAVNARDAMPRGGKLNLETANVELSETYALGHVAVTPGPHVMLAVSDTGVGMDAETRAHIFEPFFTTKEQGKGTGLGLATVYGIVKQSGGNIWVYSEPGHGTTFKIYLPRVAEAIEAVRPARAPTVLQGSETILLVEDEEAVRSLVRGVLESKGYKVLEAGGADHALLISEQYKSPIQLLLTDVVMPQMGGRELAVHLARLHPETKALFMSGYTANAIVHHGALDAGMSFLPKPFTPEGLVRKVREVLDTPRE